MPGPGTAGAEGRLLTVGVPFEIAAALRDRTKVGLAVVAPVAVRETSDALGREIEAVAADLHERHAGRAPSEVPGVPEARALYRALGLDPTKIRPSNEALLRRVLRGDALYRVNTLVDSVNLVSLRRQLPFGLYDLDRIDPPVSLRLGDEGESYPGIRKGAINVAGRPVLADAAGPFGNPSADSERTSIRLGTTRALVIAWAPVRLAASELGAALDDAVQTATRHCGGEPVERRLLPDAAS